MEEQISRRGAYLSQTPTTLDLELCLSRYRHLRIPDILRTLKVERNA